MELIINYLIINKKYKKIELDFLYKTMKYFCFIAIFLIAICIVDDPLQIEFSNFKKTYNKVILMQMKKKKDLIFSKKTLKNMDI